jgi:hypothetical protein
VSLQVSLCVIGLDRILVVNHHQDYLRQETEIEIEIAKEIGKEIAIVIEIAIEIVTCCLDIDHQLDHLQGT